MDTSYLPVPGVEIPSSVLVARLVALAVARVSDRDAAAGRAREALIAVSYTHLTLPTKA